MHIRIIFLVSCLSRSPPFSPLRFGLCVSVVHFPTLPHSSFRLVCSVVSSFVRSSLDCLCTRLFGHLLYMLFHKIDTLHTETHTHTHTIFLDIAPLFFPISSTVLSRPPHPFRFHSLCCIGTHYTIQFAKYIRYTCMLLSFCHSCLPTSSVVCSLRAHHT